MSFGSGVVHSQNCPVPGDSDNLKNLANGCQINLWIGFPFAPKKIIISTQNKTRHLTKSVQVHAHFL